MNSENSKRAFSKSVSLFVRILPEVEVDNETIKVDVNRKNLYVRSLQDFGRSRTTKNYWRFSADQIFTIEDQVYVYDNVCSGIVQNVTKGQSTIIIGYGQTGTGKTFSITGLHNAYPLRGICPRILSDLIKYKYNIQHEYKLKLSLSFIELRRRCFVDLLAPKKFKQYGSNFKNINIIPIHDEDEGLEYLFKGDSKRKRKIELAYEISHLYTSIVTFYIDYESVIKTNPIKHNVKIHIIDLAGTEESKKVNILKGKSIGEANLTKLFLEQFLLLLNKYGNNIEKIKVNHRVSPLIIYLYETICSRYVMKFICHVKNNRDNLHMTLSYLRFSQIIRGIKQELLPSAPDVNIKLENTYLKENLNDLMKELYLNSLMYDFEISKFITPSRLKQMERAAEDYINNKIEDITLINVSHFQTVLQIFKDMYQKLQNEKNESVKAACEASYENLMLKLNKVQTNSSTENKVRRTSKKHSNSGSTVTLTNKDKKKQSTKLSGQRESQISLGSSKVTARSKMSIGPMKTLNENTPIETPLLESRINNTPKSCVRSETFSKNEFDENVCVNRYLPSYNEAWINYMNDDTYQASYQQNVINELKNQIKECKILYQKEVHNLYDLEIVENDTLKQLKTETNIYVQMAKRAVTVVQLDRQLKSIDTLNPEELTSPTDEEDQLTKYISTVRLNLKSQKAKVINIQNDLKILLNDLQETEKNLQEQFTAYCMDQYKCTIQKPKDSYCDKIEKFKSAESFNQCKSDTDSEKHYKLLKGKFLDTRLKT